MAESVQALMDESVCFYCIPDQKAIDAMITYLMAVWAGGSTDPQELMQEASCFYCMSNKELDAIKTSLLSDLAGA